jgi:hypothetical protein
MKRRLLNLVTILSLLLCAAVAALWVRSHVVVDEVTRNEATFVSARSFDGRVEVDVLYYPERPFRPDRRGWGHERVPRGRNVPPAATGWSPVREWRLGPFRYVDASDTGYARSGGLWLGVPYRRAAAPHWFFALLAGVLPIVWLVERFGGSRQSRRLARGLCPACGYDLRASPGRCPECGGTVRRGGPVLTNASSPAGADDPRSPACQWNCIARRVG